jgi:hypothetical protein
LLEASEKWRSEKKFNAYPQNSAKQELTGRQQSGGKRNAVLSATLIRNLAAILIILLLASNLT